MIRFDFCYDFNSIKAKNAMTAKREIDYIIAKKWEFNLGKDMTLIWDATKAGVFIVVLGCRKLTFGTQQILSKPQEILL